MSIKLAVLGHPIKHSRSPEIHHAFARALGLNVRYNAIDVAPGTFNDQVQALQTAGYTGLNVTVPYKEDAFALAHQHTPRARQAGAVNTLCWDAETGRWTGDNTDGEGLVNDLTQRLQWPVQGGRVLMLGAGGAVRGVLGPLLGSHPSELIIANRTESKATALAQQFAGTAAAAGCTLSACSFSAVEGPFDLVINGTSAGLSAEVPPISKSVITPSTRSYDMMYGATTTAFNAWAEGAGAQHCADGLGMLVGQAAAAFTLWTGQRPDPVPVLAQLRQGLSM